MNARQAFTSFVSRVLKPEVAERLNCLAATEAGEKEVLEALREQFWPAIRPDITQSIDYKPLWEKPCLVYFTPMGFGITFETLRDAYEQLSIEDGWLIILEDTDTGIHRPEGRWDAEKILTGKAG